MKKLLLFAFLGVGIYSCGPSTEEKEKMEQASQDSMKAAEDMMKAAEAATIASQAQDSIMATNVDSVK